MLLAAARATAPAATAAARGAAAAAARAALATAAAAAALDPFAPELPPGTPPLPTRGWRVKSARFLDATSGGSGPPPATAAHSGAPLPEFAILGRSNVGKSTLINLLTGACACALLLAAGWRGSAGGRSSAAAAAAQCLSSPVSLALPRFRPPPQATRGWPSSPPAPAAPAPPTASS